jgi:hypothetical protein
LISFLSLSLTLFDSYDSPDDPYVLRGSCQVVFSLSSDSYAMPEDMAGISFLALCSFLLCLCLICFVWNKTSAQSQYLPQYVPVATAVDPAVAAYPSAPPMPMNPSYAPNGYGSTGGGGDGDGGGFWTGMGAGGMLGYMFGRRSVVLSPIDSLFCVSSRRGVRVGRGGSQGARLGGGPSQTTNGSG